MADEGNPQRGPDWSWATQQSPQDYMAGINTAAQGKLPSYATRYLPSDTNQQGMTQEDYGRSLLAARQFDPNATLSGAEWVPGQTTANNSETGGSTASNGYWKANINYDKNLVPKIGGDKYTDAQRANFIGVDGATMEDAAKKFKYLKDPKAFFYDPNYGWVTDKRNVIEKETWRDKALGVLGPLAVGGFAGALGGFGSALSMGQGAFGAAKGIAEGGDLRSGLLGAGLGYIGGALGGASGLPFGSAIGSMAGKTIGGSLAGPNKAQPPKTTQPTQQAQIANSPGNTRMNMGYKPPQNYNFLQNQQPQNQQAIQQNQMRQQIRPPAPALRTIYQR